MAECPKHLEIKMKILTLNFAGLLLMLSGITAGMAQAGESTNALSINGIHLNGIHLNGIHLNGLRFNGTTPDQAVNLLKILGSQPITERSIKENMKQKD